MEVAREREGRRRKRRAIEAVVVVVVVMGFGILLKRRDCVLGCLFVCVFWCFFDYLCASPFYCCCSTSSRSGFEYIVLYHYYLSSRMYVVEPVREGHCGIVCSIDLQNNK